MTNLVGKPSAASKLFAVLYGVFSYLCFFVSFVYLFLFVGDIFVPRTVSAGGASSGLSSAVVVNLALIALFGIQHSVMARPSFKIKWTQIVPKQLERSTFVLITSVILFITYAAWRPMPQVIWNLEGSFVAVILWAFYWLGALIVLLSSLMINHFDLFGLRQVFLYAQGKDYTAVPFAVRGLYKWVRNPLMLGFLISFWAAPVMTVGRLLYAAGMTLYIFIGVYFEERTIAQHLGEPYLKYRASTSMILPLKKSK